MINTQNLTIKYFPIILLILFSCTHSSNELLEESEYREFGKQLINLIKKGETDKLADLYYPKKTFDNLQDTIRSLGLKDRAEIARWEKYRSELFETFKVYTKELSNMVDDSTFIEVTRFYIDKNQAHLILTVASKERFEIVDLELLTEGDNIYISNLQSYNTGIDLGQSFLFNSINKLQYGWMGGEYMEALEQLKNAHTYLQRDQPERAWIAINRIPEYFGYQANFQVVKTNIAYQLSDSLYQNALYEWIGNNWDNEGFRYLKAYTYYKYFGDSLQAALYIDSLALQSGNNSVNEILNSYDKGD